MRLNNSFTNYGITLVPLTIEDLELVRLWRNSEKISKFARNKGYITKEDQQNWFRIVDNSDNIFFVIIIDNIKVGLIWAKDINKNCESGFYIYEDKYLNGIYSYKVVTILHEVLFDKIGVSQIYCEILSTNSRAIRFNKSLGFEYISKERYCLSKENFLQKLLSYKKIIENY